MEKQLQMCRHASTQLRAAAGKHGAGALAGLGAWRNASASARLAAAEAINATAEEVLEPEGVVTEAFASTLLLLGVLACALLNAWSLGYLQPNRHLRRALQSLGCPVEPLVR